MAKFDEKLRFLVGGAAEKAQQYVRKRLKNAIIRSQTGLVFQKVTAGVSPVKRTVRQNEMGCVYVRFFSILLMPIKKIARVIAGDVLLEITGSPPRCSEDDVCILVRRWSGVTVWMTF